jgi:acetyl esterase/lipase
MNPLETFLPPVFRDYATDPSLDPQVITFLKQLNTGGPGLETLPPAAARQVLEGAQAAVTVDLSGVDISERIIQQDGYSVPLHIVRPAGASGSRPVFMFLHGGGWVLGDFPTHQRLVRDLVVLSGCAAVFVNYTRTPEAAFPQAIEECYAATKWVAAHGAEINVDGTRLAVVGNSAGGNLAAVTALMAKDRGGPHLKLQILLWPVTNAAFDTESYQQFATDRFLTRPMMQWMYGLYVDEAQRRAVYASPLQASAAQLRGLPPTLIQVAENDVLRDEGEAYGRQLSAAGVPTTVIRYVGMIHDFGLLNSLATLPATRSLFIHAAAELRSHLG